jgi:hypothetical protein
MLFCMAIKRKSLKMCFEINGEGEIEHVIEKKSSISQNLFKLTGR